MRLLAKCFVFVVISATGLYAQGVTCSIVNASITFGNYDPIAVNAFTDETAIGSIQINCNGAITVTINLAVGTGSYASRTLSNNTSTLYYNLYADAGYTQIWGDGTSGTVTVPCTFSSSGTQTIPVYGKIPHGQTTAAAGAYNATPQVNVSLP